MYEDTLCQGCGDNLAETTDPANSAAYVAEVPVRCHKCTARYEQAAQYADQPRDPRALMFPVRFDPRRRRKKKTKR